MLRDKEPQTGRFQRTVNMLALSLVTSLSSLSASVHYKFPDVRQSKRHRTTLPLSICCCRIAELQGSGGDLAQLKLVESHCPQHCMFREAMSVVSCCRHSNLLLAFYL